MKTKSPPKRSTAGRSARKPAVRAAKSPSLKAKLVRIGNSRGVRLPKTVIEQAGLTKNVKITVEGNRVIIRSKPDADPRAGWEEQIKKALAAHGDDVDEEWLNAPLNSEWDQEEWTW